MSLSLGCLPTRGGEKQRSMAWPGLCVVPWSNVESKNDATWVGSYASDPPMGRTACKMNGSARRAACLQPYLGTWARLIGVYESARIAIDGANQVAGASLQRSRIQSSTRSPGTLLYSLVLWVTRVAPRLSAWAAIRRSIGPIGWPWFSSSARTGP